MSYKNMEIVKISAIKANSKNPRVIKDDKFRKLVQSIREFPDMLNKRPLICFTDVDGKYVVLGGNMRLKAAQEIGLKEMPIILADDWTQEQKDEFLIKDNVGFGEWNWDDLANEWDAELLDNWGLDIPNFDTEVLEAEDDDFDTTPPEISITVLGDLYEIGEHRLLCGDSTDSEQVAKLMNGEKADMVFTDPPYGINYKSNKRKDEFEYIKNDDVIDCSFLPIIPINNNSAIYVWTRWDVYPKWIELVEQSYKVTNCIVWIKQAGGLGDLESFWNQHEFAIYAVKGKVKLRGIRQGNTWETSDHRSKDYIHPTQKPVELAARGIEATSDIGNLIVDVFLGSGSTMVASHQLKRKCYGMELDPKYCDVIVNRMIALDPDIEIKLNGKPFEKAH